MNTLQKKRKSLLGKINAAEITLEVSDFNLEKKLANLESLFRKLRGVDMQIELIK